MRKWRVLLWLCFIIVMVLAVTESNADVEDDDEYDDEDEEEETPPPKPKKAKTAQQAKPAKKKQPKKKVVVVEEDDEDYDEEDEEENKKEIEKQKEAMKVAKAVKREPENTAASKSSRAFAPMFVGKDDEGSTTVKIKTKKVGTSTFACEFKHTTKSAGENENAKLNQQPQQGFPGLQRDVETILGKLSGICIRKTLDYWKYELCFDSKVIQSHGRDSFILGSYSGMDGTSQLYDEGTLCEALPGHVGRESRVEFVCDNTLRLISVEEVSTCSYKIYVSTPVVCGHPDFLQSTRTIPGKNSRSQSGPPKDEWFLELSETNTGQVVCTAQSLRTESDINFLEFELSISAVNMDLELKHEFDTVRSKGRRPLSKIDKHYTLQRSNENTRLSINSGKSFQGQVMHIFLQAVPTQLQEDL